MRIPDLWQCTAQFRTEQNSGVQYSTVQYSTVQYSTVQLRWAWPDSPVPTTNYAGDDG